jgi:hypothetical protein
MTPEERERMMWLCKRIQEEKDLKTFNQLVLELDELFEKKEQRLDSEQGKQSEPMSDA